MLDLYGFQYFLISIYLHLIILICDATKQIDLFVLWFGNNVLVNNFSIISGC